MNPFWQRRYRRANVREELLATMRHWLVGVLSQEKPELFRALPESYKLGQALPLPPPMVTKADCPKTDCGLPKHFVQSLP